MTPEKLRALSNFYREEFERHIAHLQLNGIGRDERVLGRVMQNLESVCGSSEFPALAETLLRRFDTLTRLSEISPRQGH